MASQSVERRPLPSPNPLPLSTAQEAQVNDIYYKRVRQKCADEIREFATCAAHRTITATWKCRPQKLAMNSCMVQHATLDERDRAREEWFATIEQRAKQKQEKEKKKVEQEKFHRQWWGLDDEGEKSGNDAGRKT